MTNRRRSTSVDMNSDEKWSRRRAVEVHDETADGFFAEYRGDNIVLLGSMPQIFWWAPTWLACLIEVSK